MGTPSKTRIAFVVPSMAADDASTAWARWLATAGHDVTVIPLATAPGKHSEPFDMRTEVAGATGRSRISTLTSLIEADRYDALIGVRTSANVLCLTAAGRVSRDARPLLVITEHAPLSLYLDDAPPARRRAVRAARRLYRRADLAVSSSHPVAAELTAAFGVPASRSLIVPRPVLIEMPETLPRVPAGERLQLVLTCPLTPAMRPDLVLQTAHRLAADGVATEVLSLTGGPLEPALRRQAEALGVDFITRHGDDPAQWNVSSRAVVVLASRSEGLGDELIDAAARGVPSAAVSAALGVADAIIPGVTGELALDDDPGSLAVAVLRASTLTVSDVDDWIHRFTPAASGALLQRALHYGHDLSSV